VVSYGKFVNWPLSNIYLSKLLYSNIAVKPCLFFRSFYSNDFSFGTSRQISLRSATVVENRWQRFMPIKRNHRGERTGRRPRASRAGEHTTSEIKKTTFD